MKLIIPLLALTLTKNCFSQRDCNCATSPDLRNRVDCGSIKLAGSKKLYYQFNCDSIWLTLENKNGEKIVIFSSEEIDLNYRLGFQFIKEFPKGILFRYNCPATGPCDFNLVDKITGEILETFGQLIYTSKGERINLIIYFSDTLKHSLTVHNLKTGKKYRTDFPWQRLKDFPTPEESFEESTLTEKYLILKYRYRDRNKDWKIDSIKLELVKYSR